MQIARFIINHYLLRNVGSDGVGMKPLSIPSCKSIKKRSRFYPGRAVAVTIPVMNENTKTYRIAKDATAG